MNRSLRTLDLSEMIERHIPDRRAANRGRMLIVSAACLWSLSGFFAKAPWLDSWSLQERGPVLAFWRVLAGVALIPFVRQRQWSGWLLPAGACFAIMNVAFLMALTQTGEATALWLQYTAPLWVLILGYLLLGESVSRWDLVMILLVLLGVGTILSFHLRSAPLSPWSLWGAGWGLLSGFSLSGVFLCLRRMRHFDSAWLVTVCHLCAAVLLAPWVLTHTNFPTPWQMVWLLLFGLVQMVIPYLLFSHGLRYLPAHEASCLALIEPLLVSLWVYLAWGHLPTYRPPSTTELLGGLAILIGLALRYLQPRR